MKTYIRILVLITALLCLALPKQMIAAANSDHPDPGISPDMADPSSTDWLFQPWQNPLTPTYTGCGGVPSPPRSNTTYEQQVFDLTNDQRAANGLPPFKRVDSLDQAAQYFAIDMGVDNYWPSNHETLDRVNGQLQFVCAWDARVLSYYTGAYYLAENIAYGWPSFTPAQAVQVWMNSSGHRANILSPNNWEMGVGYYASASNYHYYVQDFGQRWGVYPLIINEEAASTTTTNVNIYIYGSWSQMRLKNDNGTYGNWQAFHNSFSWTINNTGGLRTVTAELNSGSTTVTSSDAIEYIPPLPPQAFSKMAPANGTTGYLPAVQLTWNSSDYASSYQYCIDKNNNGSCDEAWENAGINTGVVVQNLDYLTTYYWQVKAFNGSGSADANSGNWWSFTTLAETDVKRMYLPLVRR